MKQRECVLKLAPIKISLLAFMACFFLIKPQCFGIWDVQTLDTEGNVGWYTSLAIEPAALEIPHISYYDVTRRQLKHAWFKQGKWHREVVDPNSAGAGTSLAIDRQGGLHIAYRSVRGELRYIQGLPWGSPHCIDSGLSEEIPSPSLALDPQQRPGITYLTREGLKYAHFNGKVWEIKLISNEQLPQEHALAIDTNGNPKIAFYNNSKKIKYIAGPSWQLSNPSPQKGNYGSHLALALDRAGNPHISFCEVLHEHSLGEDVHHDRLQYFSYSGGHWNLQLVDGSGNTGWYTSLALDSGGKAHISYHDHARWALKYAVEKENGSWILQDVDVHGAVGYCSSLKLDAAGQPHISYYDLSREDLKYSHWIKGKWTLSGRVTDSKGNPASGVHVFLVSRNLNAHTRSEKDGRFSFESVPTLPAFVLSAAQNGYIPLPARRQYPGLKTNLADQNFILSTLGRDGK